MEGPPDQLVPGIVIDVKGDDLAEQEEDVDVVGRLEDLGHVIEELGIEADQGDEEQGAEDRRRREGHVGGA